MYRPRESQTGNTRLRALTSLQKKLDETFDTLVLVNPHRISKCERDNRASTLLKRGKHQIRDIQLAKSSAAPGGGAAGGCQKGHSEENRGGGWDAC
jgi:hypothetical protein